MTERTRAIAVLPLALALCLAACGGSSDSRPTAAASSATASATPPSATTPSSTPSVRLGSGGGPFCDLVRQQFRDLPQEIGAASDPAALRKLYAEGEKSGQVLLDAAPPELKTDLQTTATLRKRIYELQVQAGFDPSKLDTAALAEAAKDPEVAQATRRVLTYMTTTCGISVGN